MKQTLSTSHAASLLTQDENANWTYAGATALVEFFEDLEEGSRNEIELDVVAIRCDYSEYKSLQEWADDYFGGSEKWDHLNADREDSDDAIRDYINDNGQLIEFDGGIIVSRF